MSQGIWDLRCDIPLAHVRHGGSASLRYSKDAVAQERVRAGDGFGGVEGGGAGCDAVRRERSLGCAADGFGRERMRQGLEGGIVFEREVNAFVGVDEDEDARAV